MGLAEAQSDAPRTRACLAPVSGEPTRGEMRAKLASGIAFGGNPRMKLRLPLYLSALIATAPGLCIAADQAQASYNFV